MATRQTLVMWTSVLAATAILMLAALVYAGASAVPCTWRHEPGKTLSLLKGDAVLWTLNLGPDHPCFHPVTVADGTVLTALAPQDHPWHHGIWFSWKFLNGVNYWDWAGKKEPVPDGRTRMVGKETVDLRSDGAVIAMDLEYFSGAAASGVKTVLKERRNLTAFTPMADGSYRLDWTLVFTASEGEVVFDRTPPKEAAWGGYAGLSFRGTAGIRDIRVIDSEGRKGMAGHGQKARWMDFSGAFGPTGAPAGVAIFDHPQNLRHPSPWYVSDKANMPYFGPAPLFAERYVLPAGKSFTLRYRMVVHSGWGDAAALENEWHVWKAESPGKNKK